MNATTSVKQPAVFVAHGGGPLPLLGHPGHAGLTKWLQSYSASLHAQPKAILVISAHWEVMFHSLVPVVINCASLLFVVLVLTFHRLFRSCAAWTSPRRFWQILEAFHHRATGDPNNCSVCYAGGNSYADKRHCARAHL